MNSPHEVNRDVLLAAMNDKVLASSSLSAVCPRSGSATGEGRQPSRREDGTGATGDPENDDDPLS